VYVYGHCSGAPISAIAAQRTIENCGLGSAEWGSEVVAVRWSWLVQRTLSKLSAG
jgi:hypothetical protein